MGFLDFFRAAPEVVNVDKNKPGGSSLITRVTQQQLVRSSQDVNKWRRALQQAESTILPNRTELMRIYQDLVLDAHLSSVTDQRTNKILAHGFSVKKDGEEDEEKTELLKSAWFEKFLKLAIESKSYGFTLIEFGSLLNDSFAEVKSVPREYVCPEKGVVFTNLSRSNGVDYLKGQFSKWVIFVGDEKNLGLLNKAAPVVLWKRLVQATWAEFNELYGIPMRIGRTDSRDKATRDNMERMLADMGSSSWGLFDKDDEIEILQGNNTGSSDTFERFIDLADAQLSKLFLGQTMTTDNGSSQSQAEVHKEVMESFTQSDLRWLSYIVNNQLLPFLTDKGLNYEGLKFEWDLSEKLSLLEQFQVDSKLMEFYKVDPEYIANTYGTPVEEREVVEAPEPANGVTIMNDVSKMYDGFFKHDKDCSCENC